MKKKILIVLIILVGGSLLLIPLLKPKDNPIVDEPLPAVFAFEGDIGTTEGKESTLKIILNEKDLAKVDVVYNGEVLKSWKNPTANLEFKIAPPRIGTRNLQLISKRKDGKTFSDDRRLRVVSDIIPETLKAVDVATHGHDVANYTQGLEFYEGRLFESTGQYGLSKLSEIDLETGKAIRTQKLDGTYFGEGITIFDGIVYQLTWKKGKCFTYSIEDSLQIQMKEYSYVGQDGWGLCNDGKSIIMSDGTERLTFRNPETFQIEKTIEVYNQDGPMTQLNELEFIDGLIYANVYTTNLIVAIDPATGKILKQINCSSLEPLGRVGREQGEVLNGIAFNEMTGKTYLTGKNWLHLFEVKFVP